MALKSILDIPAAEWQEALELSDAEIPDAVIVEGSWWRKERTAWRLSYLSDVRELPFPDIFWGRWQDKNVAFCCAYGAPRTVEIMHIFGIMGTKLAVQIGTCGGLQSHLKSGDVIVPDLAFARDGVAHLYGATEAAHGSPEWADKAEMLLSKQGIATHRGTHVTWSSLFTETVEMMVSWHQAGYLSVDMETATTFAVSRHFGMDAVSLLVVWDDLTRGKRFLDPLAPDEQAALEKGNEKVYEAALAMTEQVGA